jgi:hypothetical protein
MRKNRVVPKITVDLQTANTTIILTDQNWKNWARAIGSSLFQKVLDFP